MIIPNLWKTCSKPPTSCVDFPTFWYFSSISDPSLALGAPRSPRTCKALCPRPSAAQAHWCAPSLRGAWEVGHQASTKFWYMVGKAQTAILPGFFWWLTIWWLYGDYMVTNMTQTAILIYVVSQAFFCDSMVTTGWSYILWHQQNWSGFRHENATHFTSSTVSYQLVGSLNNPSPLSWSLGISN